MDRDCQGIIKLGKPASQIVDANSVTEILTEHSRLWRKIGLKLGLDSSVLKSIEADFTKQRDRFEEVLNAWLRLARSNATWSGLELAITNANREDLGLTSLPKLPTVPNDTHIQQGSSVQINKLLEPSPDGGARKFKTPEGIQFGWQAIVDMYQWECQRHDDGVARMIPRLREIHIIRDSWTKLNVTPAKIMQQELVLSELYQYVNSIPTPNDAANVRCTLAYLEACNQLFEKGFLSHSKICDTQGDVLKSIEQGYEYFKKWCNALYDSSITTQVTRKMLPLITTPTRASAEFGILMNKIIKELQQKENDNLDSMKCICAYFTIGKDSEILLFDDNQRAAIEACKEIKTLFTDNLRYCWKWNDIHSLKMIMQSLNSDVCMKLIDQYEKKIDVKMKLEDIFKHCEKENTILPEGFHKMVAIIKGKIFSAITEEEYDELTQFVSKQCGVYPYLMTLWKVSPFNSIVLEWIIPFTAVSFMVETSKKNINLFAEETFLYLKISSTVIFNHRNDGFSNCVTLYSVMTDTSPGDRPLADSNGSVSTDGGSEQNSVSVAEHHVGSNNGNSDQIYAFNFEYHKGITFCLRSNSERLCPSFTYACPPGISPTPVEWKMCCDPKSDVSSEHVTYHQLTASDESLSAVVKQYIDSDAKIIGLIVINYTASRFLTDKFLNKISLSQLPIYVVSLEDGKEIEEFVSQQKEGDVQIKVSVESSADSQPVGLSVPSGMPVSTSESYFPDNPSQSRFGAIKVTGHFSLNDELKKNLHINKKRIHVCASHEDFQALLSCFHNHEIAKKKESSDKAIKNLFSEDAFEKDFPFYLLLGYRFLMYNDSYGGPGNETVSNYLIQCITKLETMDTESIANVLYPFMQRGDFLVQFNHVQKSEESVFELLYYMAKIMLAKSNKLWGKKEKASFNGIRRRILWITLKIFFGIRLETIDETDLVGTWESELFNERIQNGLTFSINAVKEFADGFGLFNALKLSKECCMEFSSLGLFLNPVKVKNLHVQLIIELLIAAEAYLPWSPIHFLRRFLPPMRTNYTEIFGNVKLMDWRRVCKDGTKSGAYREVLKFLEYIYMAVSKLEVSDVEKRHVTEIVNSEIQKWLELLVKNVDIKAKEAVPLYNLLRTELKPAELLRKFKPVVIACIKTRAMKVTQEISIVQFHILLTELIILPFEFVKDFLEKCNLPMTVDLKDQHWKPLLEEIMYRHSDSHCKCCIIGLMKRIGEAYKIGKRHPNFVLDLMKLDVPDLLLVDTSKERDPDVEKQFVSMICVFIQGNGLRNIILNQVGLIMTLVKSNNHFQELILTAVQKEVVPDNRMIEKLNSTNNLKVLLVNAVAVVIKTLDSLQKLTCVDKFYWSFIASCCNHIQLDADNLDKIATYAFVIEKLGRVFQEYCTIKRINDHMLSEVPQYINQISNNNVNDYFKWIVRMQSIVAHWRNKFGSDGFNYDDIFVYANGSVHFEKFAKAINATSLLYLTDEITKIKKKYFTPYSKLCSLLVRSIKDVDWCTLIEMLNYYGLRLDHSIQVKLDAHVILPRSVSAVDPSEIQQGLNQLDGQLDLEPDMTIMLRKSTTLKVLRELNLDLQNYLNPICTQLEFLAYFHLHNCEMFIRYLKNQVDNFSSLEITVDNDKVLLAFPSHPESSKADKKLNQFASALENTKAFILSLIKGTATYEEIFAEGTLESLQKFDAESEFKIMCGFSGFKELSSTNEEGKQGIMNMLELFQYSQEISVIPNVCAQYHLQGCLNDPKLKEIKKIVNDCKNTDDRAKITGQIASKHMKKIWEVLNFDDPKHAKRCLKIFPAVANCAQFYQFIKGKGFTSETGRSAFRSQVELITAQLQHEDYNETVLIHLTPAFAYITPFLDTEQTLGELMAKIIQLFNEGTGFGSDPRKDFCQLETVNSNITMIQLWFSRTEGDTLENVAKELDCIMKTGYFELVICPKQITGYLQTYTSAAAESNSQVLLYYEPIEELYHKICQDQILNESQTSETMIPVSPVSKPISPVSKGQSFALLGRWKNEQIDDFVRKLGFLETQNVEQPVQSIEQSTQSISQPKQSVTQLKQIISQPMQNVERPPQSVEQPPQSVEQPTERVEQSPQSVEQPTTSVEQPTERVEQSPQSVEQPTTSVEEPTESIQQLTGSLQQPIQSVQQLTQNVEQPVKRFQQLSQTAVKVYDMLIKLRDLGHPKYLNKKIRISCSDTLELTEQVVKDTENELKEWRAKIKALYKCYDKLLFFSVSKVLSLHDILESQNFSAIAMIKEISFLFENDITTVLKLKKAIEKCKNSYLGSKNKDEIPVEYVGKFLQQLCSNMSLAEHFLCSRSQPMSFDKGKSLLSFQEIVHFAPNYDNGQLLRLLIEIYNGVPESYEVFHCSEDSTEEDLKLFLHRASTFRYRTFTVLKVNLLPYKLQELILHHHSREAQVLESCTRLDYIETANSVLHEMPWVVVKEYKANGPNLSLDNAKITCDKYVNKRNADFLLELVYGCAGDGKTHYIRKKLDIPHLIIAVNESFTPLSAILKLRDLPQEKSCTVFFNFTIVTPVESTSEEESQYAKLMNMLAWFFFKLLIFGYVEDVETGMAFRLPGGQFWRIYIEFITIIQEKVFMFKEATSAQFCDEGIVAITEVPSHFDDVDYNLKWFCNKIPVLHLLGKHKLIEKERFYDVDEGVQLVCKYLRAYKNCKKKNEGINRLYRDNATRLVKFGDDSDLKETECHMLLNMYMPEHVKRSKVLQRLFIKYMERRCNFLENFPGFNFNSGCGTLFNQKLVSSSELQQMVKDNMLVNLKGAYYTNTSKLGEVLLETMLQEVSEFCKIHVQQNWAPQAHQQLIYATDQGLGTIQLITLRPEDLDKNQIKKFKALGIEIPSVRELLDRKKLDFYLSRALGVELKDEKLEDIDKSHYVLTLDYTVKMLNIHERRQCGIPVIIEGETGVGKTALINMLSKLWNHALINEWQVVKRRIIDLLYHKSLDLDDHLKKVLKELENSDHQLNGHLDAPDKHITEDDILPLLKLDHSVDNVPYYVSINNYLVQLMKTEHILELIEVKINTIPDNKSQFLVTTGVEESETVKELFTNAINTPSAEATAKLLCALLNGSLIPTFYKLNIHAALTPRDIHSFFIPIINRAKHLKKVHESKKFISDPPVVTVFLDELNTSSCMGLFKEMIIDRSFEGEPLPSNIFLVAACNPHRGNSLPIHENKDEHKAETWVRGSYYVQKLHPTLRFLMWDYGSLNKDQESAYIKAKMIMVNYDFGIVQNITFSELVVKCQELIREFAYHQLIQFGISETEARLCATSSVSQRDIQRVFTFYTWILKTYEALQIPLVDQNQTGSMVLGDMPSACITKHPMISDDLTLAEMKQRALLVALGLVYYVRLDSDYRERFAMELDKTILGVKFHTAFRQEMDFYINELSLPAGIAKTEALKENLFATIICTVTNTPLIIVGAPGSSKTLSFNLTVSNLKGPESKHQLFRNTEVFKSLDPHYYQCSRRTTSTEIETVFQRAINTQQNHKNFSFPIRCVVFMDEAGLPEEQHESLKILHYHLDEQEVAFVAITNHILDAAKTNRAVSLFRPTASQEDLQTLAKGCLCANPDRPPSELRHALETIVKLCPAYCKVMKDKRFEKFFGLRDFIHFINYIRRCHNGNITPQLVLQSLERNFNGCEGFEELCKMFLTEVDSTLDDLNRRTIIDILHSSLDDKSYSNKAAQVGLIRIKNKTLHGDKGQDHHDTQNEVRYKLIIDPSEDESITQLLFMFGILKREKTRTYMCSDFPGDGQLQKINTIAAIRHSAIEGHTVIMRQTDDIHESFYDLFNQHFRRIYDPSESVPRYFTNIAIGAHTKPSRVDREFQCIVVIKESEIKNTPAPFLNRFEKYFISHENLLNLVLDALPPCLRVIAKITYNKVEEFFSFLDPNSFYGGKKETVCSLLLGILPKPGHKYEPQSQSLVPVHEDNTDGTSTGQLGTSFVVTPQSSSKKTLLLQILLKCLHEVGGFCYMMGELEKYKMDILQELEHSRETLKEVEHKRETLQESKKHNSKELEHDANNIINLLATAGSEFCGVAEELENCEPDAISQWVAEALDLVYTGAAPPNIDTTDYKDDDFATLGASKGACMITALIAQWLVRFMCKKLMQLMTPEAAIVKRKSIPIPYLEAYLNFQSHFSLKEFIKKQMSILNMCNEGEVATKLICYTRSSSSVHQLPAVYPRSTLSTSKELEKIITQMICEQAEVLFLCKFSSITSQTAFKLQLQSFVRSHQRTVFVLVVNMQETSHQIINHIRIMIEEAENINGKANKLFVLLLHFPPLMFYDPCYPSLFLPGWDHYYLDTIYQTNKSSLVDTKEWFRESCLFAKEPSVSNGKLDDPMNKLDDTMCKQLQELLNEPESIQIIASRILLNVGSNESLDSFSDISTKSRYLRRLLIEKQLGLIFCLKFKSYWKPSVMGDHLEQAAQFARSRESTLNITDAVDSMYKTAFFNFIAYMVYQISKSHGLELLFGTYCDDATLDLFLKLLEIYPVPKLSEIKAFNNTWDCRVHTVSKIGYIPQFPFFKEVSTYINYMIEQNVAEVNESTNILENGSASEIKGGPQDKEQMLKKLCEHVCDKMDAAIKGEKTVGEKSMSAIAIKEIQNDENLWQKYYNDFTSYFLRMSSAPNNIDHKLLQLTFTDVLRSYSKKPIAAHCYVHLYQLDLAKIVALLKPLGQLHMVKDDQESPFSEDPEYTLVTTLQKSRSGLGSKSISKFVIESLFAVLINAVYSKNNGTSQLQQWFSSYRDMMSMSSMRAILSKQLTVILKAKCHLMEVTFSVLQSFDEITELAGNCAIVYTRYMCSKFFTDKFELNKDVPLSLEQSIKCFDVMIENPQFEEVVKKQLYHHILEGIISHFFPDTDSSTSLYCKEDVKYFLSFANKQSTLKYFALKDAKTQSHISLSHSCISLSKFKFYLDKILCKGWSKDGKSLKPLELYKFEVCKCIGETILQQCSPECTPSEYFPPYLQQNQDSKNPLMQQMLTHLYFYTLLEKLQSCHYSPSQLVVLITAIDKLQKLHGYDSASSAEKLIFYVERQALLEVLLQAIVDVFYKDEKDKLESLLQCSDQINQIVLTKEKSHSDVLLMLLIKKFHGPRGVLNLSDKHKQYWEAFDCLKLIRGNLKSSHPTSHQFPFIVNSSQSKHRFAKLYRDVCIHLKNMSQGQSSSVNKLINLVDSRASDNTQVVCMMIWLGVYYEFYCNKKANPELIQQLEAAQKELKLLPEHLNVLKCFLDPAKMIKREEVANPLNPNIEMLEVTKTGHVQRKHPPTNAPKRDAIWEFFNLDKHEDPSDTDLRHALANMIAVVFALPSHSNHVWYHMFYPEELENTHLTGFMYPKTVKKGGLMYDCGCELNEDGQYGRKDYIPHATRGTLSVHSWYLMLWTNFGAFCVGLLTQPTAHEKLNGRILSDWMSIRDYCMTQLRTVWLHMRTNMGFGDDERSFFVMRSMHTLFMAFQEKCFPCPEGKFTDLEALNAYEKAWHKHIYEPAKANLQAELENHSSHSVWAQPVLKKFRMLDQHYPHLVTENDYIKSLVTARETCNFNPTYLFALHHFTLEYERLQVGGALLPDLVEFYQWIHTHLPYLVTFQRAQQITIGNVISLSAKRYSSKLCDQLTKLFEGIIGKYNKYLNVSGGVIGDATCNKALKATDVRQISKDTPLIRLISLEDTTKNDWLYRVLTDIIENHNSFLNSIFGHTTHSYQKYLPDSPPESHVTEVTSHSCVVPSEGNTGKEQFLKMIKSCYVYSGVQSSPLFNLVQLEQNIVAFYIAGKPHIRLDGIRTVFRFKNIPNETVLENNPGCAFDLSAIGQELPSKYKESLQKETRKIFEYDFRTATYHALNEIVTGLRTVLGHLSQDIIRNQGKAWDATLNVRLVDYLKKLYNKEQKVFNEIGIQSINEAQLKLMEEVPMKRLFKCISMFVGWLQGGLYDFSFLPVSVFNHLEPKDMETLDKIHQNYLSVGMDRLLVDLDEFEKSLSHAEQHLITQADHRKSIIVVLVDCKLCDLEEKFVSLIPTTILVCHYIHFRMALRKVKIKVTGLARLQMQSSTSAVGKWTEIIEDLWKYLPHFQDEEQLYDDNCLKFDCVHLQFGDGEESENDSQTWLHHNTSDMEESLVEVQASSSISQMLQKIEDNPQLKEFLAQTFTPVTTSVSPVSNPATSASPSSVYVPSSASDKAKSMTHEELCAWLKEKKIKEEYIDLFKEESIDGEEMATYGEAELEELGISESRIRKRILVNFGKIK